MTGPQVPEGLAQRLSEWHDEMAMDGEHSDVLTPYIADMEAAADIVRFWERVAPFLDDDTIRLAEAAADVREAVPEQWTVTLDMRWIVCKSSAGKTFEVEMYGGFDKWRVTIKVNGAGRYLAHLFDDPIAAARAALAALSGDPTDG